VPWRSFLQADGSGHVPDDTWGFEEMESEEGPEAIGAEGWNADREDLGDEGIWEDLL
jgi:hypothetical protein